MAPASAFTRLVRKLSRRVRSTIAPVPDIPAALWLQTVSRYRFLAELPLHDQAKLRALSALFLQRKEFTGAHGLEVTDAMAVAIAAQACLPLLHWGEPAGALAWYDDFVGIVVHPGEAVARRQSVDEAGVVHDYDEVLLGEAMDRGPVMLSWPAVDGAGRLPGGRRPGQRHERGRARVRAQAGHAQRRRGRLSSPCPRVSLARRAPVRHASGGAQPGNRPTRISGSGSSSPSASAASGPGWTPTAPPRRRNSSPWPARPISSAANASRRNSRR